GERKAEDRSEYADQNGERGEAVYAGVLTVGNEGRGANLAADLDAKERHALIAKKANEGGDRHPAWIPERSWGDQLPVTLICGDERAREDHDDDENACNVLRAAVAVSVATSRRTAAENEGNAER